MGTVTERVRKDKSIGYTAQIRLKQGGRVIHTEAKTFDRRQAAQAAQAWLDKRERELAQPGALETAKAEDPTLSEVIGRYIRESKRDLGRTKNQVLTAIQAAPIGAMRSSQIDSPAWVSFAQSLKVLPQTVENYLSHIGAVVAIARPAWGYPLDEKALADARKVLKRLSAPGKSANRERRPTLEELDRILTHFEGIQKRRPDSAPMHVAAVTGHRSWTSLKRYTHLRHSGDKWADWKWLGVIAPATQSDREARRDA